MIVLTPELVNATTMEINVLELTVFLRSIIVPVYLVPMLEIGLLTRYAVLQEQEEVAVVQHVVIITSETLTLTQGYVLEGFAALPAASHGRLAESFLERSAAVTM